MVKPAPGDDQQGSHAINPNSGRPKNGTHALHSVVPANKAAILPGNISFSNGVVLLLTLEAVLCDLFV